LLGICWSDEGAASCRFRHPPLAGSTRSRSSAQPTEARRLSAAPRDPLRKAKRRPEQASRRRRRISRIAAFFAPRPLPGPALRRDSFSPRAPLQPVPRRLAEARRP
jgi:hypothetical protein